MKGIVTVTKSVAIVIVGIFIFKLVSGYLAGKYPNAVTNAVNAVVQAA